MYQRGQARQSRRNPGDQREPPPGETKRVTGRKVDWRGEAVYDHDMKYTRDNRSFPSAAILKTEADIAYLRSLTLEERARMIESACRAAAEIRRSRLAAGLPDAVPEPWPESTLAFMKKHARKSRGA